MRGKRAKALRKAARAVTMGEPEALTRVMYRQMKRAYKQRLIDGHGRPLARSK